MAHLKSCIVVVVVAICFYGTSAVWVGGSKNVSVGGGAGGEVLGGSKGELNISITFKNEFAAKFVVLLRASYVAYLKVITTLEEDAEVARSSAFRLFVESMNAFYVRFQNVAFTSLNEFVTTLVEGLINLKTAISNGQKLVDYLNSQGSRVYATAVEGCVAGLKALYSSAENLRVLAGITVGGSGDGGAAGEVSGGSKGELNISISFSNEVAAKFVVLLRASYVAYLNVITTLEEDAEVARSSAFRLFVESMNAFYVRFQNVAFTSLNEFVTTLVEGLINLKTAISNGQKLVDYLNSQGSRVYGTAVAGCVTGLKALYSSAENLRVLAGITAGGSGHGEVSGGSKGELNISITFDNEFAAKFVAALKASYSAYIVVITTLEEDAEVAGSSAFRLFVEQIDDFYAIFLNVVFTSVDEFVTTCVKGISNLQTAIKNGQKLVDDLNSQGNLVYGAAVAGFVAGLEALLTLAQSLSAIISGTAGGDVGGGKCCPCN